MHAYSWFMDQPVFLTFLYANLKLFDCFKLCGQDCRIMNAFMTLGTLLHIHRFCIDWCMEHFPWVLYLSYTLCTLCKVYNLLLCSIRFCLHRIVNFCTMWIKQFLKPLKRYFTVQTFCSINDIHRYTRLLYTHSRILCVQFCF